MTQNIRIKINKEELKKKLGVKDGYTPVKNKDYFDGEKPTVEEFTTIIKSLIPPVEPPPTDSPKEIIIKLESVENNDEKLSIEAIKDLREELDDLKKQKTVYVGGGSGATGGGIVKAYDLSASLNGTTKTFNLPAFWRVISVHLSSFPNILRETIDYTTDGSAMTITFTSEINASTSLATGQTLIIIYAES